MKPMLRALMFVGLVMLAGAVGVGVLRQGEGPNPITELSAWATWARADAITAFLLLVGAAMSGIGAVAGVLQIFGDKPLKADDSRRAHDRIRDTVVDDGETTRRELAEVKAILARMEAQSASQGRTLAADERAQIEATLTDVAQSTGPDLEQARAGLSDEDPIALIDGLEAAAVQDAANRLRQAGTIAYAIDVERARRIYAKVAALEPDDHWTKVLLGRLHRAAGDLTAARTAARHALDTSSDERERSVALDALGDVARAEGDLPAARAAFEEGLTIAKDLSTRDPGNTEWKRDLSVS
ncbi:MAG: hypothetical protein KJ861_13895, partial [Alphaproteobacteria bacterium]|nr:hypothetical protein [Alphaproteobacteria bacterium]MBU2383689.1 hypothetical protein [Alphaproteobacteria bacterium]